MKSSNPLASDLDTPLLKARSFHIDSVDSFVNAPKDDATGSVEVVEEKKHHTASARGLLLAVVAVALKVFGVGGRGGPSTPRWLARVLHRGWSPACLAT